MALELSISNIFHLTSLISPILLSFFLVMSSLFNLDIKAIVYLMGVLIASICNIFIMNLIKQPVYKDQAYSCNFFEVPYGNANLYNNPSSSSLFLAFTMIYLILPMIYNNSFNYGVLIFFISLLIIDAYSKLVKKCTSSSGVLFGIVLGLFFGIFWYTIIDGAGYKSLLYFDELKSNKLLCSRPSKQNFKCKIYKNGQLIGAS